MADEKGKKNELELDGGGKKKKMIIIIAIIAVVLIAGGGYYFFRGNNGGDTSEQAKSSQGSSNEANADENAPAQVGSALYVPMPRPFRFNIPGATRDRFIEIRVQLLVRGADNEENAKMHIPLIESTLLNIFSQANADDLATSVGKEVLKDQSLSAVQLVMKDLKGNETVEKVLFTGFIMQ